jgi:hypothetical protein
MIFNIIEGFKIAKTKRSCRIYGKHALKGWTNYKWLNEGI